jgi:hypothetical protein
MASYGDQDNDNDQPAEAIPLPDTYPQTAVNYCPPSGGPFSNQRQDAQANRRRIMGQPVSDRQYGGIKNLKGAR